MPLHLMGFISNIDSAAVFANLVPIPDPMLTINGNNVRVPPDMTQIIMAAGGADGVVIPRIRLTSPTLIKTGRPEIKPLNVQNAVPVVPDSPPGVMWLTEDPLQLTGIENLSCELNNNPAAAQDQWALLLLADKSPAPVVNGLVQTHRATSTTAAVVRTWTNVNFVFDDQLQPGTYALVGLRPMSANMIAARVVFPNDPAHRPGALGGATAQSKTDKMFRAGRLGSWGTFPFEQQPTIDVLCAAADATQEFEIDLIRIGD